MFFETTLTTARIGASRGFWADRRLQEFLDEAVLEDPTRTATVDARGRLTFGELAEQTDLVASALLISVFAPVTSWAPSCRTGTSSWF